MGALKEAKKSSRQFWQELPFSAGRATVRVRVRVKVRVGVGVRVCVCV